MADVKLSTPRLRVILGDDSELIVQATNADLVKFDMTRSRQKWPAATEAPFLWLTFIAWHALRRTGGIPQTTTYEQFSDSTQEIANLSDDESTADADRDAVGPTPQGAELD